MFFAEWIKNKLKRNTNPNFFSVYGGKNIRGGDTGGNGGGKSRRISDNFGEKMENKI